MSRSLNKASTRQILATYWRAMVRHPWQLTIVWASILLGTATSIVAPIFYKRFFDVLAGAAAPTGALAQTLLGIIFMVLWLNVLNWIFWRIATLANNFYQPRVYVDLRQDCFDYLLGHSYRFFADNFGGALVQKVNRLSRSFESIFDNVNWSLLPLITRIVGVTVVLWFFNPVIAVILLIWMAIFMLANIFLSHWKTKYDLVVSERDSRTTGALADAITNHSNIQLFSAFDRESRVFRAVNELYRKAQKLAWDVEVVIESVQAALMAAAEFLLFYFALRYWQDGLVTVGFFVLIQTYLLQLFGQMWDFGRTVRYIYRGLADAEEIVAIMNLPHEVTDIPGAKTLKVRKGEIEFRDAEFSFHETRKVLRRINLRVAPGEKVALIGPSGAGKSTIVKLLLRLYDLERGAIFIDGQDIHTVTQESLRASLSLVPQDPILFHRTLFENIRYGKPNASRQEVEKAAQLAHCSDFIELLPEKYDTYVGERGIKLSGGERQRVAIARAILKNAPILVLDEATSSLDSHSENLIQRALRNLMRGKTVIVIAHRLSTIRTMDRIVVVEEGRIREEGTHAGLLRKPRSLYARLWKLQAGGFLKPRQQDRLTALIKEKKSMIEEDEQ